MSLMDETIRLDMRKQDVTIPRSTVTMSTYMVAENTGQDAGKRRLDPFLSYETFARFPSDSTIVPGDKIISGSISYLVMAIEPKYDGGEINYYRATMYKCNSTVSIYYYNESSKKHNTLYTSGVKCLITQVRAQEWLEDKALAMRPYQGKQQPFQVFAQDICGINAECILVDQDSRRYRVSKESDVFVADGILQAQLMWER